MRKRFILNADDFGMSKAINSAVLEGYSGDLLKSVSLCAVGKAFDEAADVILPKCEGLGVGIHLNITQGTALCTDVDKLTDSNMNFNNNFFKLFIKSYNFKDKEFLLQVEREFRRQIEKVMAKAKVTHIDSHSHIHAIPPIFNIVCRLAKEYKIPYVRTHFEKIYFIPDLYRHFNKKFFKNFLKKFLLNLLTVFNENTVIKQKLKTNDYIIGITYGGSMDSLAISYGIKSLNYDNIVVEAIIHPCRYEEGTIDNHFDEYIITRNKKLKEKLLRLGYEITNYEIKQKDN